MPLSLTAQPSVRVSIHSIAAKGSSRKPLCTILHNIQLQLVFPASWRFLCAESYHNILWRRTKLRNLGRDAGSYHFLMSRPPAAASGRAAAMRPRASVTIQDEEILPSPESMPYDEQGYLCTTVIAHRVRFDSHQP